MAAFVRIFAQKVTAEICPVQPLVIAWCQLLTFNLVAYTMPTLFLLIFFMFLIWFKVMF
jgi:hypothetical protein